MKIRYLGVLLILVCTVIISACADKTVVDNNPERPQYDPSPTVVVERFLKALQEENFKKAYEYTYVPSTDEAGYVIQMRNVFKENQIKINSFQILGTQIFEFNATVAVQLEQVLKSPSTGQIITLNQKSKYSLGLYDKKWKVVSDNCYEGCLEEEVPEIEIAE